MAQREFRTQEGLEFRQIGEDTERTFRARVCNYGVPDTYRTSWAPGVFTRSLGTKLPKAVWSHDWNRPIGKVVAFHDGPEGLDVDVQLADFDAVPDARMAYSLLKDGIIDNFSFGFVRKADEPDPDNRGVTRITDVDLDEISPVLVGSVPGTRTLAVRSDGLYEVVEERTLVTEAGAPKSADGAKLADFDAPKKAMKRTPHTYRASNGDGSVCATCGGQTDIKAHTNRAATPAEIRDVSMVITADPETETTDPGELVAATDAAIDAAIALASYQDLTNLPWWVAQMVALLMAADTTVDAAMVALGVPDPDEQVTDGYVRAMLDERETRAPQPDPELDAAMARLNRATSR